MTAATSRRLAAFRARHYLEAMTTPFAVLRLGGARARSGRLGKSLGPISTHVRRVVVVPGGGPFADTFRSTQGQIGFGDVARTKWR
jgi:aspartokinase-like uncharacterized kinase